MAKLICYDRLVSIVDVCIPVYHSPFIRQILRRHMLTAHRSSSTLLCRLDHRLLSYRRSRCRHPRDKRAACLGRRCRRGSRRRRRRSTRVGSNRLRGRLHTSIGLLAVKVCIQIVRLVCVRHGLCQPVLRAGPRKALLTKPHVDRGEIRRCQVACCARAQGLDDVTAEHVFRWGTAKRCNRRRCVCIYSTNCVPGAFHKPGCGTGGGAPCEPCASARAPALF